MSVAVPSVVSLRSKLRLWDVLRGGLIALVTERLVLGEVEVLTVVHAIVPHNAVISSIARP